MVCDECGKRPATVHITKIENGKKTDMHLCEQCAMSKNAINFNANFSINDLLTGLLSGGSPYSIKMDMTDEPKCNVCGLTYNKFRQTGRFGCSSCYKTFGERLNPLFNKVHGNISHTGKVPAKAGIKIRTLREIDRLKKELNEAIENEEYEKAAVIRDKIKQLMKQDKEEE